MKKIFLTILLGAALSPAFAQKTKDNTLTKKKPAKNGSCYLTELLLKAGPTARANPLPRHPAAGRLLTAHLL
ncbi:hypothetical protein [Mucilaginibacter antarcticus]|uniref:hypothetical protein n=1 Tax=Mucilaginibacter antarcticus TaxID=1855725 RepID=UPI003635B38B